MINGLHRPDAGAIVFEGRSIERLQPHRITRRGISRTFQISRQLERPDGAGEPRACRRRAAGFADLFSHGIPHHERERAMELLDFVGIAELADAPAGEALLRAEEADGPRRRADGQAAALPARRAGGRHQSGAPRRDHRPRPTLRTRASPSSIVEHNMDVVMNVCDPVVVMAYGKVLASGTPAEIQSNATCSKPISGARDGAVSRSRTSSPATASARTS